MRKIIGKKNKVHYVEETTRFQMVKSHKGWLVIGASMFALGLGLNMPATTAHASQLDGQWKARTVQEIKADFDKSGTSQSYKIQWGDTLSAISAAINVSQDRLAQINSIENKDLIFAGNTIQIDGNGSDATITIKDQNGKADKVYNVDPNKPVVNTEKTNELQSENVNGTGSTSQTTVAANESAQATNENGNTTVNDSSSVAGSSNNGSDNSNTNPSPNKTELEKLKETLASQNAKLSDSQSKLTAAQSDLDAAKSALTAAQNKDISQFESAVQAQTEKVNGVKTDLDNIKTEIDSNTKNIESLNIVIASLKANIASADTDVVTAQNRLATAQSNSDAKQLAYKQIIATISAQYPSINVETADGLATLETSNPDLKAAFDAAKSDKDDSELVLEQAKTAVSDASVAKPNMQASLTENENKIPALTEQINTDTAKVSPLESKLTTETAALSDLQQQHDNVKNSNAEQLQANVNEKQSVVDNLAKGTESAKSDTELKVTREDAAKKTNAVSDANVADALVKTKEDAKSTIDGLKFLSNNVKSEFKAKVDAATSKDDVDKLIASLPVVAVRLSVSGYNGNLKKTVPKLIGKGFGSIVDIEVVKSGKTAVSNATEAKPNMQASLTENENKIPALTEQINTDTAKVSPLESKLTTETAALSDLQQQHDNVKNSNAEQLQANVNEKQSVVDNLAKGTESAKSDTELKVTREDAAKKTNAVSDANVADALVKTKEDAKSTIDGLKFLSNNVKSEFKAKVDAATSKDDVDKLIASLPVVAVRLSVSGYNGNLKKTVPKLIGKGFGSIVDIEVVKSGKTAVSNATEAKPNMQASLTENENKIATLTAQINTDTAKVSPLESKLTTETAALSDLQQQQHDNVKNSNAEQLQANVNEKQSVVDNLAKGTESAKSDTELKVTREDAAKKTNAVSDANVADALVKTKEDAKSTIDGLKFLSNNVKSEFKAKVDAATSKDDVDKLIASLPVVAVRLSVSGYNGNLKKTVPKLIGKGFGSIVDIEVVKSGKTAVSNATEAKPNMQASLTENENKIATLTAQINTDTAKVSPLESKLTTETAALSDLQQQPLDNVGSVAKFKNQIQGL
ncbi:LysM peptidoglycan-binding domain-containing protein [Streptococcus thermophilus]|uniref:LysM peptidoglycan-binding domain-containing protein n=7 Tax=Streptococcaceae TaxID=1300 RepID=UPI001A98FC62|nr:LysM peptidoglycan-binding domain-containing protein [Streptococcus thermophilus]MBO1149637.1 LysM peptidoglycan-binding domain-containing protein [Streptococcus thermophilus]MBO1151256.1 LysM peptidoglycan-binding domain-containing protein [Streptococcus thermophilus]QTA41682.1 LysM peptidoglycan-binding domain-containing protein [Streptococcus thermophilus]QTG32984.1 LysM peptidoglycan-binding domain-containing protein [Streptococcus thermophilus]